MMPVPYSDMKGFRNNSIGKKTNRKLCNCCSCDNVRPPKQKTKCPLTNVGPLNMIESEYIKNLQLQIYYLEMESKYLWKRTQEQEAAKRLEEKSASTAHMKDKPIGSSWDRTGDTRFGGTSSGRPIRGDSSGIYPRYNRFEDSGKSGATFDRVRSYDRPGTYKATSYRPHTYDSPGKYEGSSKYKAHFSSDFVSPGYGSSGFNDHTYRESEMNDDLERLIKNVKNQDSAIKKLNMEKTKMDELLNQEKQTHAKDMRNARDELARLRQELDNERQQKSRNESELNRLSDDLKDTEDQLRQMEIDKTMLQNQMEQRDQQVRSMQNNLEDTRHKIQAREDDINELQDKYDKSHDMFNRVAAEMREEQKVLKEHLSNADMKIQELESNRDALTDANQRLIKENAALDEEYNELQNQMQQDRHNLMEKEKQREMAADKISAMANDIKIIRGELHDSKQKVSELDGKLRETMENLYAQEAQNDRLEKRLAAANNRVSELESIRERLSSDIQELQDERTSLLDRTSLLESELCYQRGQVEQLHTKAHELNNQLKEVEELKSLENSMQTQKWAEFSKLANSMQNISRCMSQNPGTTVVIETD